MPANYKLHQTNIQLAELIKDLSITYISNYRNYNIEQITNHSQKVKQQALFLAITGFKTDGHQYIREAINQGAVAIIGEKRHQVPPTIPYIQVTDSRRALAKLAAKFYNYPSQQLRLIGVTGTAGKTTTTAMIDSIANQVVSSTGMIGTLDTKIGTKYYSHPHKCTTPNALVLHKRLAQMKQQGIDYATLEVSSHALKLNRVQEINFDLGIFTNLSADHLKFHQTFTDYYNSKAQLFKNLNQDGIAILNLDDQSTPDLINEINANHFTYGINKLAHLTAHNIIATKQGLDFKITLTQPLTTLYGKTINPTTIKLQLSILGYHNIYNTLAAVAAGLVLGFDITTIKEGLKKFTGVKRRMEIIYDKDFTIIDDFAHNPASLTANFKTIEQLNYNRLIIVHFLKGNRGVQANQTNAQVITEWSNNLNLKEIITTKSQTKVKAKNKVLSAEEAAFTKIIKKENIKITNQKQLKPAIKLGLQKINQNDILLLLGGPGLDQGKKLIKQYLS